MNRCRPSADKFLSKLFVIVLTGCLLCPVYAQPATSSFIITGGVKKELTISVSDLQKLTIHNIGDVPITNHLGEPRGTAKNLKGVLFKDVLALADFDAESPKVLSEYFFVCVASDQYTVVYSWNELFNTAVGESVFVVLEKAGRQVGQMDDSMLMISPNDYRTGRRHVKNLARVEVKRAR